MNKTIEQLSGTVVQLFEPRSITTKHGQTLVHDIIVTTESGEEVRVAKFGAKPTCNVGDNVTFPVFHTGEWKGRKEYTISRA